MELKRRHVESIRHADAKIRRYEKLLDKAKKQREEIQQHFTDQINDYCYFHQSNK